MTLNTANSIDQYHTYLYSTLRTQFRLGLYKQFWDVLASDFNTEHLILIPPAVSAHSKLTLPTTTTNNSNSNSNTIDNYHDLFFLEDMSTVVEAPVVVDTVPDDDIFGEMM